MKTIKLYGHLGKKFGKVHLYHVETVSEAIRLLSANYKEFEKSLTEFTGGYKVLLDKEECDILELHNPTGKDVIKIIPVVEGQGGAGKIITGALMLYAAYQLGPLATSEIVTLESTIITGGLKVMSSFGMSMILGGVAELLYKPPEAQIAGKQAVSSTFDGAVNTTRQGAPIALGYGELIVGSAVISAGISTVAVPV